MANEESVQERGSAGGRRRSAQRPPKRISKNLLRVEPLSIEVGVSLISFISDGRELTTVCAALPEFRKQLASDLGFIIPAVRVSQIISTLRAREYAISLKGSEVAQGLNLPLGCELAIALTASDRPPDGRPDQRSRVWRARLVDSVLVAG